jgi:hypothetical protein
VIFENVFFFVAANADGQQLFALTIDDDASAAIFDMWRAGRHGGNPITNDRISMKGLVTALPEE